MRRPMLLSGLVGLGVIALVALVTAGCSSTDASGVRNVAGSYSTIVDVTPDKATIASRKAVEDLKLNDIASSGTMFDGKVTCRTAQDSEITISIEKVGEKASRVTVRVGATGDEQMSRQILDKVNSNVHSWF
jgi:hypothetical protein